MSTSFTLAAARIAVACLALACGAAHAQLVAIAFDGQGRFASTHDIAPAKFAEACGTLRRGEVVRWQFDADSPLDFNVHYHVGDDVVYPARRDRVARAEGELRVPADQDYCWMWSNVGASTATVHLSLTRR